MAVERTLSIIKPDATCRDLTGRINARFEESGLHIVAQKRIRMTLGVAENFTKCIGAVLSLTTYALSWPQGL